jgi:glycosyltransferase involved in cell wall biosynthesis
MARVAIVVPCYNEAERLDLEAFKRFATPSQQIRFSFINDGSSDTTGALLERFCAAEPGRFGVHHLAWNAGKGEAVRQGILKALADGPDYVGFWDADLATPLEVIPSLCRVLDERPLVEVVLVWRAQRQYEKKAMRNLARHALGNVFGRTAALLLGFKLHDTQCGAKIFRVTDALPRLFEEPFLSRWIFDLEVLSRLAAAHRGTEGAQLDEVMHEFPFDSWRDVRGSKRSLLDYLIVARDLVRICWKHRKSIW